MGPANYRVDFNELYERCRAVPCHRCDYERRILLDGTGVFAKRPAMPQTPLLLFGANFYSWRICGSASGF